MGLEFVCAKNFKAAQKLRMEALRIGSGGLIRSQLGFCDLMLHECKVFDVQDSKDNLQAIDALSSHITLWKEMRLKCWRGFPESPDNYPEVPELETNSQNLILLHQMVKNLRSVFMMRYKYHDERFAYSKDDTRNISALVTYLKDKYSNPKVLLKITQADCYLEPFLFVWIELLCEYQDGDEIHEFF